MIKYELDGGRLFKVCRSGRFVGGNSKQHPGYGIRAVKIGLLCKSRANEQIGIWARGRNAGVIILDRAKGNKHH